MEQVFCENYIVCPDDTFICIYRLDHCGTCIFSDKEQRSMEREGVFCPFWQFEHGGWVDCQYFCEVQHG